MWIRTKLSLIIITPFLGLILISTILFILYRDIQQDNARRDRIYSVLNDLVYLHFLKDDMIYGSHDRVFSQWKARYRDLNNKLTALAESSSLEQSSISERMQATLNICDELITQELGEKPVSRDIDYLIPVKNEMDTKLERMLSDAKGLMATSRERTEDSIKVAGFMSVTIIVLATFLIAVNAASIRKSITTHYKSFMEGLNNIAKGRFDYRLSIKGSDETSALMNMANNMAAQIEKSFGVLNSEILRYKAASEEFSESERRLKDLIEATSDWIWEFDLQGVYTYSSPKTIDIIGYNPEEVIGKRIYDFLSQGEADFGLSGLSSFIENKLPFTGWVMPLIRKDGTVVFIESNGVPIFDRKGEIKGFRGVNRNITKRYMFNAEKERLIEELQAALHDLKILKGMLPICSSCKKVRDDNGYWQQIESYISDHSEAEFSHSICPECTKRLYPEYCDR